VALAVEGVAAHLAVAFAFDVGILLNIGEEALLVGLANAAVDVAMIGPCSRPSRSSRFIAAMTGFGLTPKVPASWLIPGIEPPKLPRRISSRRCPASCSTAERG
jgi:hypothetical protein